MVTLRRLQIMKVINSQDAPKAIGPYSQAIANGGLIFLSGQIPLDPKSGNVEAKTIEGQTSQVLSNLNAVLLAAGADLSNVVRCTVFLTDLSEFAAFNKVYGSFFPSNPPARTTVQVAKLPRDAKLEIDAIAVRA
ncbi:MAG: RidA family protein [Nitrososphaerales archaeon]